MPFDDITEYIGFVIRRVAAPIMILVNPGVIAPKISMAILREFVRSGLARLHLIRGLPNLIGVRDEVVRNENVLFGAVAHANANVVSLVGVLFETILRRLLNKKSAIVAGDEILGD